MTEVERKIRAVNLAPKVRGKNRLFIGFAIASFLSISSVPRTSLSLRVHTLLAGSR
jgi:hypothetical protein